MKLSLFIFLYLALFCRPLSAEPTIIVKGLTGQSIIVSVDGQLLILKKGVKVQNMTLLNNSYDKATLQIGNKKVTLFLDDTIAQSYAKKVKQPSKKTQTVQILYKESIYQRLKKSRITELQLLHKNHHSIKLQANYYYDGSHGDNADIAITLLNNGSASKNISRQYHRLEKGNHTLILNFDMDESKEIVFYIEAINFAFLGRKATTYTFYSKTIALKKYWNKVNLGRKNTGK